MLSSSKGARSPCIGICTATALGDDICRGCGRTFQEVIDWNVLSDEQKIEINDRIEESVMKLQVFVYGTLKQGHGNSHLCRGASNVEPAYITGTIHDLGPFPAVDYKSVSHIEALEASNDWNKDIEALHLHNQTVPYGAANISTPRVTGELVTFNNCMESSLRSLDRLEGFSAGRSNCLYYRVAVPCITVDGLVRAVWTYVMHNPRGEVCGEGVWE